MNTPVRLALALGLVVSLAAPCAVLAGPAERAAALAQSLRTKRVSHVALEKASLDDVVRFLRVATGVNFHVRRDVIAKAGVDLEALSFTVALEQVTVAGLLKLVLEPHGLAAVVRDNVVHVTTRADAIGKPVARLYGISHLTWRLTDFAGPSLDLHPSGFTAPEIVPEVVREDGLDADKISELVKELVGGDWSQEGWGISTTARFLVVRCPPAVHREVSLALARIAAFQ
jgi:hypothetical protein